MELRGFAVCRSKKWVRPIYIVSPSVLPNIVSPSVLPNIVSPSVLPNIVSPSVLPNI